jgi:MarR family transcriptional regulator, transcriptional regulator for hemolysin
MSTSAPAGVTADLAFLLSQANHALQTEMTAALESLGITPRAHCVLRGALGGELTQSQLADLCALDKTTMVVTMDELERAGLAKRTPSSTDRRARIISVTEAGERMVAAGQDIVAGIYADVLGELPERERDAFVDALERLAGGRLGTPVQCDRAPRRRVPRGHVAP